jgi:hypothetical protein
MARAHNTRLLSHIDCEGGGQVWFDNNILYVSHMRPPHGTSIYDVSDPLHPKLLSTIEIPIGWHSHKVRAQDGIMIVNHEKFRDGAPEFGGGLGIYDVSNPAAPRPIAKWRTGGSGVHRFDFDGRHVYVSPTDDGYVGNFVKILDVANPSKPEEAGRWWIPGQNVGGGEVYPWGDGPKPRCHHPLRMGNRLYVSYWHHGFFILDIADISRPKLISGLNTSPAHPHPTHTCLPIPTMLKGRNIMVVADEDVAKLRPSPPAFAWIGTIQVPGLDTDGAAQPAMTGCHQPSEVFKGTILPFAWFAQGLRIMDIADPFAPKEVGYYEPDVPAGFDRVSSNDVTQDGRGIAYLTDRQRGVDLIEMLV